jgi:aryl carrier-like protein
VPTDDEEQAMSRAEMLRQVAEQIGVPPVEVTDDANLIALGCQSIDIMTLVNRWRKDGLPVSFGELVQHPTFAGWWAHVAEVGAQATA